jgi:hypothetical protein
MGHPLTDALDAQGVLQPGIEGWWKVWGAMACDIRKGDLIMTKGDAAERYHEYEVAEIIEESGVISACRLRFRSAEGEDIAIGMLCPVIVLRKGTKNTLAGSVR